MKLIINADDFGMTIGVTRGIIWSIKEGIVRDTSFLVNSKHFDETVELAKNAGINSVGLHLTLTFAKPLSNENEVKSLVNEEGRFYKKPYLIPENFSIAEVEKEFRAQLDKFHTSGLKLSHIDSHHGAGEVLGNEVFNLILNIAKEQNVPLRRPKCSDYVKKILETGVRTTDFIDRNFGGEIHSTTEDYLIGILEKYKCKDCTVEIMSHPAIVDDELVNISSYSTNRENELNVLTSKRIMDYISKNNIELISFNEL